MSPATSYETELAPQVFGHHVRVHAKEANPLSVAQIEKGVRAPSSTARQVGPL